MLPSALRVKWETIRLRETTRACDSEFAPHGTSCLFLGSIQEVHVDSLIHTVTLPAPLKQRTRKSCSSHRASSLRIPCYIFSCRGHYNLFETWFLLVQCAHWVEAALRLLPTSSPENCRPLLWLLTFFYHPTNRGHHRASLMVSSAWERVFQSLQTENHPPPRPPPPDWQEAVMAATRSKLSFKPRRNPNQDDGKCWIPKRYWTEDEGAQRIPILHTNLLVHIDHSGQQADVKMSVSVQRKRRFWHCQSTRCHLAARQCNCSFVSLASRSSDKHGCSGLS